MTRTTADDDDGGGLDEDATASDDDSRRCEIDIRPLTKSTRVYSKCRLLVMTHRHLPYILSYMLKNVGQILALKTRGRLIHLLSFGQQVFQGCLCKLMADSCRKMPAKRRQSRSVMATADDTESATDAPTPIGMEQRFSPVASACRHRPRTTHLLASTASLRVSAVAFRHCLHTAGRSATARRPVLRMSPPAARRWSCRPSIDSYVGVKFWTFLTSKEGINLYANQLVREYILYANFHVK